ncbi:arginine--tRNA ligase [Desulfocarbo indianensis]|nr:arginine--tRNA ligase [Desulfocarbo indianensis]
MKEQLRRALLRALQSAQAAGDLPQFDHSALEFAIETPRSAEHGDLAANLALQLARPCRRKPRDIAEILVRHLAEAGGILAKAEIAGPGFINFFLNPTAWLAALPHIMGEGPNFGRSAWGAGRRVMVEFVSANPTGPLHVGHGRGAALGDALARLLEYVGCSVATEYYINDAGNQMATLGRSLLHRAQELAGSDQAFPDNHYKGEYIRELAEEYLKTLTGPAAPPSPGDQAAVKAAADWAGAKILDGIKDDLRVFGVEIDNYYSEQSLVDRGAVRASFDDLKARGLMYDNEGALWFAASRYGDEKDRVVKRSNGETTYFASDIAYHREKFERGFDQLIDVWGADHHGYVPRLKAAIQALGREPEALQVVLVQMVSLLRGGEPVAMSTRAGEFVTLREVVDEVGRDAARFIFLTRRSDSPLDFDLEVAKQKSLDNPVYYVQYAHTRVMSILRKAAEAGVNLPDPGQVDLSRLGLDEEVALARRLGEYPEAALGAAQALEPHRITYYLNEVAGAFHSYYNAQRVLGEDAGLTAARLLLSQAVGQVLRNGLGLLGVSAPEAM